MNIFILNGMNCKNLTKEQLSGENRADYEAELKRDNSFREVK